MAKIGIISCANIKDKHCIACLKCFKAMKERLGEFARYDDIEIVFMSDCGGCPGLTIPKMVRPPSRAAPSTPRTWPRSSRASSASRWWWAPTPGRPLGRAPALGWVEE